MQIPARSQVTLRPFCFSVSICNGGRFLLGCCARPASQVCPCFREPVCLQLRHLAESGGSCWLAASRSVVCAALTGGRPVRSGTRRGQVAGAAEQFRHGSTVMAGTRGPVGGLTPMALPVGFFPFCTALRAQSLFRVNQVCFPTPPHPLLDPGGVHVQ